MKVTHKEIYPHIDWDSEIANEQELDNYSQGIRSSDYMFAVIGLKDILDARIEKEGAENIDSHTKANMMRMIEYMYCKSIYHHTLFYKKYNKNSIDLKENEEDYRLSNMEHPVASIREKLGETGESNLPIEMLQELSEQLIKEVRKKRDENKPHDGGFEEAKEMFEKEGLKIEKPIGLRKEGDRDTVCVVHDGVRYHLYLMKSSSHNGMRTQEQVAKKVNDYKLLIEGYHDAIKRVYDKMKSELPDMENIWVLSGGGMQHQAFFGNENGYIAILYLGLKNSKKIDKKPPLLVFQSCESDSVWQNYKDFKVDGIICKAFRKTRDF